MSAATGTSELRALLSHCCERPVAPLPRALSCRSQSARVAARQPRSSSVCLRSSGVCLAAAAAPPAEMTSGALCHGLFRRPCSCPTGAEQGPCSRTAGLGPWFIPDSFYDGLRSHKEGDGGGSEGPCGQGGLLHLRLRRCVPGTRGAQPPPLDAICRAPLSPSEDGLLSFPRATVRAISRGSREPHTAPTGMMCVGRLGGSVDLDPVAGST